MKQHSVLNRRQRIDVLQIGSCLYQHIDGVLRESGQRKIGRRVSGDFTPGAVVNDRIQPAKETRGKSPDRFFRMQLRAVLEADFKFPASNPSAQLDEMLPLLVAGLVAAGYPVQNMHLPLRVQRLV